MLRFLNLLFLILCLSSCGNKKDSALKLSQEFKDYWYSGKAEITSYDLEQARYGEMRNGHAVLIYVTEDFLPDEQVKADEPNDDNISVLKLNSTKKFNTGIYPYSIMQSCFYPLNGKGHALKVAASVQEWCGQVYIQLNNRNNYEITSHSYFAGEADQDFNVEKAPLENEVWTQLRIGPKSVPTGDFKMIPSLEYLRLHHKDLKAYSAHGEFYTDKNYNVYTLEYPELERKLKIYLTLNFPYSIEKWEETSASGFGKNKKILTTKAVKKQRLNIDYWNRNTNKDLYLREKLGLN
ncbi:septum formation inhibitor Maf [Christiangramia fulva]|uniref:Septum formation inhibitor Maf n=1 Tax=Christiangramia fulva TaxID=2126553 RepID=A0A2R3Z7H1_9FLAO|nr:septum formation inhibitor Maf [Christiangramia fulva]AVR46152.1 septum formation inhibitor Maf [Christiangramia fulva]